MAGASRELVLSKVKQIFPDRENTEILELLDSYDTESYEPEQSRVQLAILKLSGGNVDELIRQVKTLKFDMRDVVGPAEEPQFVQLLFDEMEDSVDDAGMQQIIRADREQYLTWLHGDDKSAWPGEE